MDLDLNFLLLFGSGLQKKADLDQDDQLSMSCAHISENQGCGSEFVLICFFCPFTRISIFSNYLNPHFFLLQLMEYGPVFCALWVRICKFFLLDPDLISELVAQISDPGLLMYLKFKENLLFVLFPFISGKFRKSRTGQKNHKIISWQINPQWENVFISI